MSTSSTETERGNLQYDAVWTEEMKSPWYPTFGHPLIYYSQVQPFGRWQRIPETEKNKPNCFKKAFRWYTQNRRTDSSSNMNKVDVKGFAAWLDEKYDEFLQASQADRAKYILSQTSAVEMDKTNYSAWKKHRKYVKAKDKGDVILRSNHSIEIILKPKDLSRPASECCQRTKVQSCCNHSTCAVASNRCTLPKVTQQKSRSLTSVDLHIVPFDISDHCVKNEESELKKNSNDKNAKKKSKWKRKKYRPRNVSCQCSKFMNGKVDAYNQVEDKGMKESNPCSCKLNNTELKTSLDNCNNEKDLVTLETKPNRVPKYGLQSAETTFTATSTNNEYNREAFLAPVSVAAQTSDYSINLHQNVHSEYPLFMKIICADKLKEN